MKYDFDTPVNRMGTDSVKWKVAPGELPMWVADMDFPTAPPIQEAILKRAQHGIFGYSVLPDEWYDAYIGWWRDRHQLLLQKEWLMFATGVIPVVSSSIRKLTTPGEKVVIQSPVYNIFYNSILNNGCTVLDSPLVYDGTNFSIDWTDLEEKLADPQATMMILCNPHNPVGKIWPAETLARIGELCKKHHVIVLSDEIHCDITRPGMLYTPFASVSETCREISITAIAPTKTFNIAGIQTAAAFVPGEALRHKVWRALNTDEAAEPNVFAVHAAVAAFTEGGEWLDELRLYVQGNKDLAADYIAANIPQMKVTPSDATYLIWLDCSAFTDDSKAFAEAIRAKTGLFLSNGAQYGGIGTRFLRMNMACPRSLVEDGLRRLKEAVTEG